eukprot:768752-Hanusia_phi.AAC.2
MGTRAVRVRFIDSSVVLYSSSSAKALSKKCFVLTPAQEEFMSKAIKNEYNSARGVEMIFQSKILKATAAPDCRLCSQSSMKIGHVDHRFNL